MPLVAAHPPARDRGRIWRTRGRSTPRSWAWAAASACAAWRASLEARLGGRDRPGGELASLARQRAGRGRPHHTPRRRPRPGPQVYRRDPERLHTASDGQFAVRKASHNGRPLVQVLRQRPGRQRPHLHRRAPAAVALGRHQRRRARERLRHRRPDARATWSAATSTRPTAMATPRRSSPSPTSWASPTPRGSRTWATRRVSGFRSRRGTDRSRWSIVPDKSVREDLVVARWDDVLRLIATIKLKEATAPPTSSGA